MAKVGARSGEHRTRVLDLGARLLLTGFIREQGRVISPGGGGEMNTSAVYRSAFCVHHVDDREVSWPRAECSEHYQLAAADYHNSAPWGLAAVGGLLAAVALRVVRALRPWDARGR